jgi:hypothetical protein
MARQPRDLLGPAPARPSLLVRLLALYPVAWRARYGEELRELLADEAVTPGAVAAVLAGALDAHLHPHAASSGTLAARVERRRLEALGVLCACIGAVVAALFFLEGERELAWARLMQAHPDLRVCWSLLLAGAALAALAALSGGGPLLVVVAREARRQRHGDLRLLLLAAPALLLFAGSNALDWQGGWDAHLPTALDVGVDFGVHGLVVLAVALATGTVCLAILRSGVSDRMVRVALAAEVPGAVGIGTMLLGALVWIAGAHRDAPALFSDQLVAVRLALMILLLLASAGLAARGVVRGLTA